jgi:glucose-6-phosphate isomerase
MTHASAQFPHGNYSCVTPAGTSASRARKSVSSWKGTQRAALDFLVPAQSSCADQDHQNLAIANCVAQAEAFLNGQSADTVRADLERQNMPPERWSR